MLVADPGFNKSYLPAFWAARQLCWHKIRRRRPQKQNASRSLRGKKRGRAKIPSPQPPSFLPARAFSLAPRNCGAISSVQKRFGFRQIIALKTIDLLVNCFLCSDDEEFPPRAPSRPSFNRRAGFLIFNI